MNRRLENRIIYLEQLQKGPTGISALSKAELRQEIADRMKVKCDALNMDTTDLSIDQMVDMSHIWQPALKDRLQGVISEDEAIQRLREAYEAVTQPRPFTQPGG
jgi:hypothetical protein